MSHAVASIDLNPSSQTGLPHPAVPRRTFWSRLTPTRQDGLLRTGTLWVYPAGALLVPQTDSSRNVFVLRRGCVRVVSQGSNGRQVLLAVRDAGDVLGEMTGVADVPRAASVYAIHDVQVLVVPARSFQQFLRVHDDAATALRASLATRLHDSDVSRRSAVVRSVEQRLAIVLLNLAARHGQPAAPTGVLIDLPLSHEDIAGLVITSTRTVDRVLMRLRRDGVLLTGRRAIVIRDPVRLRELCH